jgi:hypothetical protein
MDEKKILEELIVSSRQANDEQGARPANFEGADLSGVSFGKIFKKARPNEYLFLGRANFRRAKLRGADLSGIELISADFSEADLEGANLSGARLNGARFLNARLIQTDLSGARAYFVKLAGAKLEGLKLKGVDSDIFKDDSSAAPTESEVKQAAIAAAKEAAATTELAGLSAGNKAALAEAAEDLWHHSGIPALEAKFSGKAASAIVHGEKIWKTFQTAAVGALRARLSKGSKTPPPSKGKASTAKKSPAKKRAPKKSTVGTRR